MANNNLLASDNFASGSLAAGWSPLFTLTKCQVIGSGASAVAEPNALSTDAGQMWTGLAFTNDQISEVTLGAGWVAESNTTLQFWLRAQSGARSGYAINVSGAAGAGILTLFSGNAGTFTQLGSSTTGLTTAAGDVWSAQIFGPSIVVYQNSVLRFSWVDTTWASGSPGFVLNSGVNITHAQVSSWRGYSGVQQDGIWAKQGASTIPLVAGDINTGASFVNSGIDSSSIILHEGNAQILSGTVYKMWFGTASGIQYAESTDGLNWTRFGSTVIAGFSYPQVIKNGSTYYLYAQSNTVAAGTGNINVFTSTNGTTWANQSSSVISLGTAGQWDAFSIYLFSPVYIDGGGTWHALYSGVNASNVFAMGKATSTDGITWVKYGSNPIVSAVWASVPYLINGTWYLWGEGVPPGQATTPDPTTGIRLQSTDPNLLVWTNRVQSIQHSQLSEGVNTVLGFSYPNALITVGSQTYMYYEQGPKNTGSSTGSSWSLSLAIAPASMASVITANEDAVQQIATDNFTSGAGPLSANWATPTGGTALQIVSGPFVEPTILNNLCQAVYTAGTFNANQYSEVTQQTLIGTIDQSFIQPTVRASTTSVTQYEGYAASPSGTKDAAVKIFKRVNGVGTQIGPSATVTPQTGDVWRLSVITGSDGFPVLSLFQNGYLILQVQDESTTPITSGNPGMQARSSVAIVDAQISLWAAGNANVVPSYPSDVSGNAGVAGAKVSYSGAASGSVTADGLGNFIIHNLAAGSYTITPSLTAHQFSPISRAVVVTGSGAAITGVNFTTKILSGGLSFDFRFRF